MEDKMYLQIFITFVNLDQIRDNKAKGPTKDKLTNIYTSKIWSLTRNKFLLLKLSKQIKIHITWWLLKTVTCEY